jgi:carbamoylphosphate synthase large subunit
MELMQKHRFKSGSPTVLIGGAGTGTAYGIMTAIRRVFSQNVRIVGIDVNPPEMVTASLICDTLVQVPYANSPEFGGCLSGIIEDQKIDAFLPLLPGEIQASLALAQSSRGESPLEFLTGSQELARLSIDKLSMAQWLDANNLPTPRTTNPGESPMGEALFLKPRAGTGSHGARKVTTAELERLLPSLGPEWIVQEICGGQEVTVDAFHDPSNHFFRAVARDRLEVKSGVSTKCRVREDAELEALAHQLATKLEVAGAFCFQVLGGPGDWRIIDVNSRPGAGTAISAACGNDFAAALIARWLQSDYTTLFERLAVPTIVTRQYTEFRMN